MREQTPDGELKTRLERNLARLESQRYDTDHVFHTTDSGDPWPGDTEGRLVLGVVLEAQALQQTPRHLEDILRRFPEKLNARGLFGKERPASVFDEQLLSSHGWVLRALSELYLWNQDGRALQWMDRMLDSLALPLAGTALAAYPLNPTARKHGRAESGFVNQELNGWKLSSDTGCLFIFFDGLVQAASVLGRKDVQPVIEGLRDLMLRMDLVGIKAQTHASLTGLRALCRLYEQNRSVHLLRAIEERWLLYRNTAMTTNGENFNWFGRPEWTEPCAVVDSFLVAVHLWRFTRNPLYLQDAHLIYYNGLAAEQRSNGGFGLNSCTHAAAPVLRMHEFEATWCCTMRGGEGLARAAEFALFTDDDGVVVAFPREGRACVRQRGEFIELKQSTGYPHEGWSRIDVIGVSARFHGKLKLFCAEWMKEPRVKLNGQEIDARSEAGSLIVSVPLKRGDRLDWTFQQPVRTVGSGDENIAVYRGPLLLGVRGDARSKLMKLGRTLPAVAPGAPLEIEGNVFTPVYHLMDPAAEQKSYACQVLFRRQDDKEERT